MTFSNQQKKRYYKALIAKDKSFEGLFFVGVITTGVFCRPTCSARKPKFEHCEFFKEAKLALLAGFRACLKCKPLSQPDEISDEVQILIQAIDQCPEKKWTQKDFEALSIHARKASRLFKKRFNMTFVAYARARRMGLALKQIKNKGKKVIEAQLDLGYESSSGFRDAFSKIMNFPPKKADQIHLLKAEWIDTLLGPMLAIGNDEALYLLEFVNRRGLEKEIEHLRIKQSIQIVPGSARSLHQIRKELKLYFQGKLKNFETPVKLIGSDFQKKIWNALKRIPYGVTYSYLQLAKEVNAPRATRAIGRANGLNILALIIPCHRVIQSNGKLAGYGGGVEKKKWLIEHEKHFKDL